MRGANGIKRDRQIVGDEVGGEGAVGADAADLAGGDKNRVRLGLCHEAVDGVGASQIEIAAVGGDDVAVFALKPPHDGGADHAGVAGDENALALQVEYDRRTAHLAF